MQTACMVIDLLPLSCPVKARTTTSTFTTHTAWAAASSACFGRWIIGQAITTQLTQEMCAAGALSSTKNSSPQAAQASNVNRRDCMRLMHGP